MTRNGQNPEGDITWTCSTLVKTNYDQAWVNVKKAGNSTLTVTYQDSLTQTFTLNVSTSDVKELIKNKVTVILSVLVQELIQQTYNTYKLRRDSMLLKSKEMEALPVVTLNETTQIGEDVENQLDSLIYANESDEIIISKNEANNILNNDIFKKTVEYKKKSEIMAKRINLELQLISIAKLMVTPEKFPTFKNEVTTNLLTNVAALGIGTLDALVNSDEKNFKNLLLKVVIDVLNKISESEFGTNE